ncbi:MAG: ATP-binding cassette domain-containing protein [Paludibacteraceae bacterium]|nr:ATP-binding cassette domain-containing protein [Paludibacteraceae bacterium]
MILVEHLHKSIGKTSILNDVSLHINEGEVVGLLGPNGVGKSTLMKVLTGLWKAEGRVEVCGVDVLACPDDVHRHIGYLPEQNPLYQDMYVREYLQFIARMRSDSSSVEELIRLVGLTPEADKRIRELSKGYKQRVGLAAAMTGNPEVLILDEPTTGLDPNQLEDIRALIRELGKSHTVILSTHILQEVKAICSRVIILDHGQIHMDKPLAEIPDLETAFKQATQ